MWGSVVGIIAVGFAGVFFCHLTRLWLTRQQGYVLLFAVLTVGAYGITVGALIEFLLVWWGVDLPKLEVPVSAREALDEQAPLAGPTSFGLLFIVAVAVIVNRMVSVEDAGRQSCAVAGDLTELLLDDSIEEQYLVELTMENGKVY